MKILVADDDVIARQMLDALLTKWGYNVVKADNGDDAWNILHSEDAPPLTILDWMMPGMSGVEICQKLRESFQTKLLYIILLTVKGREEDIVSGLDAGADDYITKPFRNEELRARVQVGRRIVYLQSELGSRVKELQAAISHIRTLQGILPICSYCKKIRDDKNYWQQLESYISKHSDARFSHSICPECYDKHVKPQLEEIGIKMEKRII